MKKLILIIAISIISLIAKSQFYNTYYYAYPYLEFISITSINPTNATVNFAYSGNGCGVKEVYIEWSDGNTQRSTTQTPSHSPYVNSSQYLYQLTASNDCYVYVRITNCFGTNQFIRYFSTLTGGNTPTVVTNAATSITQSQATLNGNITSSGDASVTDKGFYYGLLNPPTTKVSFGSGGTGTYSVGLGGLSSNTQYHFKAYAVNSYGESVGETLNFNTSPSGTVPTVTTTVASNITTNSALSGGNVTNDNGSPVTARGVYYSTTPSPNYGTPSGSGTGIFSTTLSSLAPNTTYYYRAYATNSYGTGYGTEYTFTTQAVINLPTVTTTVASNISINSLSTGGNVTNQGGSSVTARGVVASVNPDPTVDSREFQTSDGSGTGVFTSSLSGLTPETKYYIRAYATNSYGTAYGSQVEATTLNYPTVETSNILDITASSATLGGNVISDGGSTVTVRGILVNNVSEGTPSLSNYDYKIDIGTGEGYYSTNLTGLSPTTTYYVRAYATNSIGTSYGSVLTFATQNLVVLPTVYTSTPSSIGTSSAVLGGNITFDGRGTITGRGVVYSSTDATPRIGEVGVTQDANGSGVGIFSETISGLSGNTTYYVCAYATNSAGTSYGEPIPFMTSVSMTVPTVTTSTPADITTRGATLGGVIVSDGGSVVLNRGYRIYNYSGALLVTISDLTGINFSSFYNYLTCYNTSYYVEAFATNSVGTGVGQRIEFKTLNANKTIYIQFTYLQLKETCGGGSIEAIDQQSAEDLADELYKKCWFGANYSNLGSLKSISTMVVGDYFYGGTTSCKFGGYWGVIVDGTTYYIINTVAGVLTYKAIYVPSL